MNPYLRILSPTKGSTNELDDLLVNRNVLLAKGNVGEANLLDARIAQLKADGMKPTQAACFSADTEILTPSGKKPICNLKKGDKIVSIRRKGKRTIETIKEVKVYPAAVLRKYHLENGTIISATRHHTVLTTKGWKKLGNLKVRDRLVLSQMGKSTDIALKKISDVWIAPVYNLHSTGPHNFLVNGLIAHNFTFARRLRSLWHDLHEFSPSLNYDIQFKTNPTT